MLCVLSIALAGLVSTSCSDYQKLLNGDDTAEKYKQTKDPSLIWEGHRAGMVQGYSHIEKLNNLDKLPNYGFKVSAFPFKIKNGSAGFVRVVAIFK